MKNVKFFFLLSFALVLGACAKDDDTNPDNNPGTNPTQTDSLTVPFTDIRTGTFSGQGGYPVSGNTRLGKDAKSVYFVRLDNNFQTTFHTGSVTMYLSKNMNLKLNDAASFIKLAVVNKNGAADFKLSGEPAADFRYVIVWCAPAGVQFGQAELK